MKRIGLIALLAALLFIIRYRLFAWSLGLPPPKYHVQVERALMIPTRDSVRLCTDHYHPVTTEQNPTIMIRSPYGRNMRSGLFGWGLEFCARLFAERGYEVIVQDTRGRFDSEGKFEPFFYEHQDAEATFDWLAQQPWFDGRVGMWGASYLGIVQWAAADNPVVKALIPGITASNLYNIIFPDGALDLGLATRWMSLLRIQQKRHRSILQAAILLEIEWDIHPAFSHLPTIEADTVMRDGPIDYYHQWIEALLNDPAFSQHLRLSHAGQVHAHVHLISGWYDFFLRGLLDDYATLKAAGKNPYLTIGPWTHFSQLFLTPIMLKAGIEWLDAHLKGKHEKLRPAPVRLYIMGINEWRSYDSYPPPSQPAHYYLRGEGQLGSFPFASTPSQYLYDPLHPAPMLGGAQFHILAGARNNRKLERRADVLTFTTDRLTKPVEIIGFPQLELYLRSSSEFTDFYARLCDVYPNGKSVNICDGFIRLEPDKGERQPDGSIRVQINLWATAYRFLPGHRIRLLVSSSAHPHWSRHTNTAHPLTDKVTCPATQIIYHDIDHPSVLILPDAGM